MRRQYSLDELAQLTNTETDPVKAVLFELMQAAIPFTSSKTVTETSGTAPLMERLEEVIDKAQEQL
jgi:hypothetical protein